ncbi:hypothetical protein Droror1_Dr00012497 [Drosera rotundifolia]
MSVTAYIHHVRALSRTLSLADDPISDTDLIFLLLAGLPLEFDLVVAAIQLATPLPSLDLVAVILTDFEQRLKNHQSTSLSSIVLVAAADQRSFPGVSSSEQGSSRGSSFSNRQGNGYPFSSRGRGSSSRGRNQTRAAPIIRDSNSVYCYKCGYSNHKVNVCEAPASATTTAQAFIALRISYQTDSSWTATKTEEKELSADGDDGARRREAEAEAGPEKRRRRKRGE